MIAGEVPASPAAIRRELTTERSDERSFAVGRTFIDHLLRFKGDRDDYAAGIAAHVIRRWPNPENRRWFAFVMGSVAEMIEDNVEMKVPLLELPRTTVRRLKASSSEAPG